MSKTNEIRVVLVKGGRNEWDEAGRIVGSTDLPLSARGREEAEALAAQMVGARLAAVICGPDEASRTLAEMVAVAASSDGTSIPKVKAIDELAEICHGLWEGMLSGELEEKCPKAYRQWIDDPASVVVPEGETLDEAQERLIGGVSRVLDRVREDSGAVAVVLRPMALALVRAWLDGGLEGGLDGGRAKNLWSIVKKAPGIEWRSVRRDQLKRAREQTKASI